MADFNCVSGDVVTCLDDDGQTPADEVFKLIDKLEKDGADVVFARYASKKHNIFRNMGSKMNNFMAVYLVDKLKDLFISSYFVCKRFVIDEIIKYEPPYPYTAGLLIRTSNNICNVDVTHRNRKISRSGYSFKKLIGLWLNGFTSFSVKPLRLATLLGFLCALDGFLFGLWTIIKRLINLRACLRATARQLQ
jgi:undecaprenyl-phosphate 4-deoxy-4-formamido-L-arabinose transferase